MFIGKVRLENDDYLDCIEEKVLDNTLNSKCTLYDYIYLHHHSWF